MKFKTLALIAVSSAMTLPAFAAESDIQAIDTLFGTSISNTATLTYKAGENNPTITSDPVYFNVDRRVIFTLTNGNGNNGATEAVLVTAGSEATTIYTLKNDSNAPIDFKLPTPDTDVTYTFLQGGSVYTPDVDGLIQLTKGETGDGSTDEITITVTYQVPNGAANGSTFITPFSVTAVEPVSDARIPDVDADNGDAINGADKGDLIIPVADSVAWDQNAIQTVTSIADSVFSILIDGEQLFEVEGADITLVKTVSILSDPINGKTNPKAIPGAVIKYTLTVSNSGKANALEVILADDLSSLTEKLEFIDTASSSFMYDGASTILKQDGTSTDLKATLNESVLTFPTVTVPKNDGINNGIVTATFEAVLK
jgi:uncharacterized repeat protein (TIGR01451 family)